MSADGKVAVGLGWSSCSSGDAVVWTNANGGWTPTRLQHLGMTNGFNRGTVVSDDGRVVGGFAQASAAVDRSPAVWQNGTGTLLDPSGTAVGEVLSMSPDGAMAAGQWNTMNDAGSPVQVGFYWTPQGGVAFVPTLPNPNLQDFVYLTAIADGDKLILGAAGDPGWPLDLNGSEELAIAWTKASGTRKLQDLVRTQGIALPANYHLTSANAASADGTAVLGVATDVDPTLPQPVRHTFVLRMPVSAYGL
jgi:hypothetical protein